MADQVLKEVIDAAKGCTFPLALEFENRTQYDLLITPGFPFLPDTANTPVAQCGQTGAPSVIATPPKRIEAATSKDAKDVAALDGHAVGLDGLVGAIAYTGFNNNEALFSFGLAWFLGGGYKPSYACTSTSDGHALDYMGQYWFAPGGWLARTPDDEGHCPPSKAPWTSVGYTLPAISITVEGQTQEIIVRAVPGGNNDGYSVVMEVEQKGYEPPDG